MKIFFLTNFNTGIASYSNFEFTAQITDTLIDSADLLFSWNFGDNTSSVETGPYVEHIFERPGTYKVSVSAVFNSQVYSYDSYVNVEYNFTYNPIKNNFSAHKIFKNKENKNLAEIIQDLAISPIFFESPKFFQEFLYGIFGDIPRNPSSDVGIVLYEKISNFLSNHSDIDFCNIKNLQNLSKKLDTSMDNLLLNYPIPIKRLMDIGSINVNRLFGDFYVDEFYFPDRLSTFTPNASSQINSFNAPISSNKLIAARNRLKNKEYTTIYTPVINLSSVYSLSDLAIYLNWPDDWWNSNYYYYYTPTINPEQACGVIDWSNPENTFFNSRENRIEWLASGGFLENMFALELYKGLDLLGKFETDIIIPSVYWYSKNNTDWYDLTNWYFDKELKFPSTNLPVLGANLFLLGSKKPIIDICDSRWVPPSSINVGSLGVSVTAASSTFFNVNIIGELSPLITFNENVVFASQEYAIPALFWYSSSSSIKDWYNISCWYGDKDLQFKAQGLPLSGSHLTILGNVRPEIDLDDSRWATPSSVNVGTAGLIVKSDYGKSFDVNIHGSSNPLVIFNIRTLYADLS